MNFVRYLSPASIDLDVDAYLYEVDEEKQTKEACRRREEAILDSIARLLNASGKITNCSKLTSSLIFNHRKASSAIGNGIAIPHARCMQTKTLTMGFARCCKGIDFGAPDNNKVQIFIGMAAPPYDDRLYLRVYKTIADSFLNTDVKEKLLQANEPGEIIWIFNRYFD